MRWACERSNNPAGLTNDLAKKQMDNFCELLLCCVLKDIGEVLSKGHFKVIASVIFLFRHYL